MTTISDAYGNATDYLAALSHTDTGENAEILEDLTAVSRYFDWKLGRRNGFSQDAAVVPRTYYPSGSCAYERTLFVDDIATATGLLLKTDDDNDGLFTDETAWTIETDFVLWPENAALGSEPRPWDAIWVPEWSTKSGFLSGRRVQVTSKGGWPAIPGAIEKALYQVTAILRLESPRATQRIPEGIDGAVQASDTGVDIVSALLQAYAHRDMGALAFS